MTRLEDTLIVYVDGEEVPGLLVYGLRDSSNTAAWSIPEPAVGLGTAATSTRLSGDSWEVILHTVPLPPDFDFHAIDAFATRTLAAVIQQGFDVAWIAPEGAFVEPPYLFLPSEMAVGVLLAMTRDGILGSLPGPGEAVSYLSDAELLSLRGASRTLSTAS